MRLKTKRAKMPLSRLATNCNPQGLGAGAAGSSGLNAAAIFACWCLARACAHVNRAKNGPCW